MRKYGYYEHKATATATSDYGEFIWAPFFRGACTQFPGFQPRGDKWPIPRVNCPTLGPAVLFAGE